MEEAKKQYLEIKNPIILQSLMKCSTSEDIKAILEREGLKTEEAKKDKTDEEILRDIEKNIKSWKKHDHLKKRPNEKLDFHDDKTVGDVEDILKNLHEIYNKHKKEFKTDGDFIRILQTLLVVVEAWQKKDTSRLKKYGEIKHKDLIIDIKNLIVSHIKPKLNIPK